AARRAAQAAAAEADALKRQSTMRGPVKALRIGDLLKARRKPILMAAAAVMLALAGLQLGKAFVSDPVDIASNDTAPMAAAQPAESASIGTVNEPKTDTETAGDSAPDHAVRQAEPSESVAEDDMPAQAAIVTPSYG
ncbi:MAG: peptidoglycan-binding protein, partial [Mesorhizobium sp.]